MLSLLLYTTILFTNMAKKNDAPKMALKTVKAVSKPLPKVKDVPKKSEVKPIAKSAPKPDAWSDSAYVARNYKEVAAKDTAKTAPTPKKKVVAKATTSKAVLTPKTSHY